MLPDPYWRDEKRDLTVYHARCEDLFLEWGADHFGSVIADSPYGLKTWPKEWEWDEWTQVCEELWEMGDLIWYYCRGVPRKLAMAQDRDSFLFLIHRGAIRGMHKIRQIADFGGLRTMTTWDGSEMLVRGVIECEGPIIPVEPLIPVSGFQGFRYFAGLSDLEVLSHADPQPRET